MKSRSTFDNMTLLVLAFLLFVFLACGGGSAVKSEPAASADSPAAPSAAGPKETPLGKKYDRIVFQKFEYEPQIEADYPGAVAECEKSALEAVIAKKIFASAVRETTGARVCGRSAGQGQGNQSPDRQYRRSHVGWRIRRQFRDEFTDEIDRRLERGGGKGKGAFNEQQPLGRFLVGGKQRQVPAD